MKPYAILLLVWISLPFAAHSQTETPKWKTQFSVRSMVSGYWYKNYGFSIPPTVGKIAFSYGVQGGVGLKLKPRWRLFMGLGYTQFGSRFQYKFNQGFVVNDPNDPLYIDLLKRMDNLYASSRLHLLEIPIRLDYYLNPGEQGWVFGIGFNPSLQFGDSYKNNFFGDGTWNTEFYSPKTSFRCAEFQAGRTWSTGGKYTLETRLLVYGDAFRQSGQLSNRAGLGLQVLVQW
jgi:hypothetical protein